MITYFKRLMTNFSKVFPREIVVLYAVFQSFLLFVLPFGWIGAASFDPIQSPIDVGNVEMAIQIV